MSKMTTNSNPVEPPPDTMLTPSQALAAKIAERLIQEGLMTSEGAKKLLPNLADGKLRAEDWRLSVELGEKKGGKA